VQIITLADIFSECFQDKPSDSANPHRCIVYAADLTNEWQTDGRRERANRVISGFPEPPPPVVRKGSILSPFSAAFRPLF
jgi:hypothetical protein